MLRTAEEAELRYLRATRFGRFFHTFSGLRHNQAVITGPQAKLPGRFAL